MVVCVCVCVCVCVFLFVATQHGCVFLCVGTQHGCVLAVCCYMVVCLLFAATQRQSDDALFRSHIHVSTSRSHIPVSTSVHIYMCVSFTHT